MAHANLTPPHDPLSELTMLVQRTKQMAQDIPHSTRSRSRVFDDNDRAIDLYRVIAGICGEALEQVRAASTPTSPATLEAAQALLRIARICTTEYDEICQEAAARRERTRRWSEVHDEFEAAQREGRPMRSAWSWERHASWEGPITCPSPSPPSWS